MQKYFLEKCSSRLILICRLNLAVFRRFHAICDSSVVFLNRIAPEHRSKVLVWCPGQSKTIQIWRKSRCWARLGRGLAGHLEWPQLRYHKFELSPTTSNHLSVPQTTLDRFLLAFMHRIIWLPMRFCIHGYDNLCA